MRVAAMLLCVVLCAIITGCGSIGEPLYPALKIPMRVTDLNAVERGAQIDVSFTSPSQTTEGLAIKTPGKVDLRIGPNAGPGFDLGKWLESAEIIELAAPAAPGMVLKHIPVEKYVGKDEVMAVRIANEKGRYSDWSNPVPLSVEQPLTTPANLKTEATAQGVALSWTSPEGAAQYRIYRKSQDEQTPTQLTISDQPNYLDATAEFDKRYNYYVEALHEKTASEVAGPVTITPKDIFPPAVPTGLNASAGVGAVELAWNRNTESDFKEYRVLRAEGSGPFAQISAGLDAPLYSDTKVQSGETYRYRVIAVDQLGNPSEPCAPVEITVP
jgi:hypothetical protein